MSESAPYFVWDIARFGDLLLLAGGSDEEGSRYWVSRDGVNWQLRRIPSLYEVFGFVVGRDRIIAVTRNGGNYAVSEDISYWKAANQMSRGIHFDGEVFWMLEGAKWSVDGLEWNETTLPRPLASAASLGGVTFVSDNSGGSWRSLDKDSWNKEADRNLSYNRFEDHLIVTSQHTSNAWRSYDGVNLELINMSDYDPGYYIEGTYITYGSPLLFSRDLQEWYPLFIIADGFDENSLNGILSFNGMSILLSGGQVFVFGVPDEVSEIEQLSSSGPLKWNLHENREAVIWLEDAGISVESIYWKVNGQRIEGQNGLELRWQPSRPGTYQIQAVWSPDGSEWFTTDSKTVVVS